MNFEEEELDENLLLLSNIKNNEEDTQEFSLRPKVFKWLYLDSMFNILDWLSAYMIESVISTYSFRLVRASL